MSACANEASSAGSAIIIHYPCDKRERKNCFIKANHATLLDLGTEHNDSIDNWIDVKCNSRNLIGLLAMVYEPL